MPWPFHKSKNDALAALPDWFSRLGYVGDLLDDSRLEIRDLALSWVNDEVWATGTAWWSRREQSGWSGVNLRIVDSALVPLGTVALPTSSPSGHIVGVGWQPRLGAVGLLMDRTGGKLRNPTILELDEGFVVTADRLGTPTEPNRGSVSYPFTVEDLVSAHRSTLV